MEEAPPGPHSVLLVDLNNFARYPSLSIGYLAAVLRRGGCAVRVFAPLMVGVRGVVREARVGRFDLLAAKLNHYVATSGSDRLRAWRDRLAAGRLSEINRQADAVVAGFRDELARTRPQAVMISTYLMYRAVCERICALCQRDGIPVLVGGPYFSQRAVIEDWLAIPGLSALAAGEVELHLPHILDALVRGGDVSAFAGAIVRGANGATAGTVAQPLLALDDVPHPDYSDFPWERYPNRIVPVVTGRGCGWGVCHFCSDITSTAGRTFRTRDAADVLAELRGHHQRYGVSRFVFTDLKLNSNVAMWRALGGRMQEVVPGARWIGSVHVDSQGDNGLSGSELRAAAASGCVRLTTGLETGSQRMARLMRKGTQVEAIARFLHEAMGAGISCRCTMVLGYPGEQADDVHASAEFLERNANVIERVSLNRLAVTTGTRLHELLQRKPGRFPSVHIVSEDAATARVDHRHDVMQQRAHRRAVMRLLTAAHRINARPLTARAAEFEGVM
jgi:anaerobic magnesium-protoporphyrin IX monomethyl ester cyclase